MSACAVEAVNSFALVGLEQLEKLFPILQQPSDEVSVWVHAWNLSNRWLSGKSQQIYFK